MGIVERMEGKERGKRRVWKGSRGGREGGGGRVTEGGINSIFPASANIR